MSQPSIQNVSNIRKEEEWAMVLYAGNVNLQAVPLNTYPAVNEEQVQPVKRKRGRPRKEGPKPSNEPHPADPFKPKTIKQKSLPIDGYVVQCATCMKYRYIPSEDGYMAIREKLEEDPFFCDLASKWRPGLSCDVGEDKLDHDGDGRQVIWAWDTHGISVPPSGWKRIVRLRQSKDRFADVYYQPPTGRKLRSNVEVQKYLDAHPQPGVDISKFSFQLPKASREEYAKKRGPKKRTSKGIELNLSLTIPGLG